MERYFTLLFILAVILMAANLYPQAGTITWALSSSQGVVNYADAFTAASGAPTPFFTSIAYNTTWAPQPYGCKYGSAAGWPASQTGQVATQYVEFKCTSTLYLTQTIFSITFDLATVGGTKILIMTYWSNDNFVTNNNMPGTQALGTKDTWYPFTFTPEAVVAAGGSFSVRFYPYNGLTSLATSKYMGLRNLVFHILTGDAVRDLNKMPTQFGLNQNYPNPFNPTTVISYQLSAVSKVNLRVYDILGNEVAVLVNEVKPAGYYSVGFDASKLTSGVYIYKMQAGGNAIQTKKMILLR